MVDRLRIELRLPACKAGVLTVITISPNGCYTTRFLRINSLVGTIDFPQHGQVHCARHLLPINCSDLHVGHLIVCFICFLLLFSGAGGPSRTDNLLITNQLRCQLRHTGIWRRVQESNLRTLSGRLFSKQLV